MYLVSEEYTRGESVIVSVIGVYELFENAIRDILKAQEEHRETALRDGYTAVEVATMFPIPRIYEDGFDTIIMDSPNAAYYITTVETDKPLDVYMATKKKEEVED